MTISQTKTLNITAAGSYNIAKTGGQDKFTVYIYGADGGATIEIHGPGGLIEDGAVAAFPYQKVVNHGGIPIQLVVTGGSSIDLNVRVG
jgi:hypothetical protein